MGILLADIQIEHCYDEDDHEQDQCSSTGGAFLITDCTVNKANHCIQSVVVGYGAHGITEDTDDAGVLLEATDKAGDDNISQHGGKQGNGDAGEHSPTGSGVNTGSLVVLLVDTLQTAQQDEDLKGQCVPYNIDHHNHDVCPVLGAGIHPVDVINAYNIKKSKDPLCIYILWLEYAEDKKTFADKYRRSKRVRRS